MATIKAIEGRSIHQIQSGQVIVDLCSVVKELVENSLDASATSIDVRFKNNGLEAIEVQDNGHGISPNDYETIALKHYTSKLSSYNDLSSLQTFGFRGEALSSLCALSKFHILTARATDGPKGTRLDFETSGKLKGTSVAASQKGTTVAVENLFYNLPVRKRELEKNIKREYGKVLGLLHAYACISVGVRFSVSNQAAKGKKVSVFSTKANPTTRENIANVYGAKTLTALIPLDLKLEMAPTTIGTQSAKSWSTQDDQHSKEVRIDGHISRPVVGEGRQTPDRQMFFVNSRPCALPQVSKAVNEVYKSFNVTQSPFIFANLVMDTNAYDVNVSPDKRTILLHDQTALLEAMKEALVALFEEHDQSVPQAHLGLKKLGQFKPLDFVRQSSATRESEGGGDARIGANESNTGSSPPRVEEKGNASVSLIQQFAGRDATNRSQLSPAGEVRRKSVEVSGDKQKLALFLAKGNEEPDSQPQEDTDDMQLVSSPREPPTLPQAVQDFNDRIASQEAKRNRPQEPSPERTECGEQEPSIAVIRTSSQKNDTGPIQNAFDRMRPKRAPAETATITIGDKTTTMKIGTPEAKRRRIHTPKHSLHSEPLPSPGKKSGFVSCLKLFAAPGTQVDEENDEISDDGSKGEEREEQSQSESDEAPNSSALGEAQDKDSDVDMAESGDDASDTDDEEPVADTSEKRPNDNESPDRVGNSGDQNGADLPRADSPLFVQQDEDSDDEYLDEDEKKAREDARVAEIIAKAEENSARPSHDNAKRATNILKGGVKKTSTLQLIQHLETSVSRIEQTLSQLNQQLEACAKVADGDGLPSDGKTDQTPEERLSLTVSKSDFGRMRIIGQFNLGFILAVRPGTTTNAVPQPTPTPARSSSSSTTTTTPAPSATPSSSSPSHAADELFIIDQHASDEKINFERLSNTTILAPQRLVHPHPLDLTAIEEETILAHPAAFAANGFQLTTDTSGESPVGRRCRLLGLPVSKETTFAVADLEELVALLGESSIAEERGGGEGGGGGGGGSSGGAVGIPRPGKVRKMLAMRACRSSIMIGKTLTKRQMERVVREMGEIDKPWNCPHGRPTMRHLASLGEWGEVGWKEGDGIVGLGERRGKGKGSVWGRFVSGERRGVE
ncbi:dna mismatch repair protein [Diplodia corticola]|uniref:DNA mismatch repair protein PMS1 n=1 Tax=Diplodia corticola TaxID=236234 RepID=A0A1J9RHX9_9PEZI|nr:dna mismatch repair protein [Diplodia corticola]OJD32163.1 dna mismatch repair protein [Diplodia corticola]